MSELETKQFSCGIPGTDSGFIKLGHGSGGKMTAELIEDLFLKKLSDPTLEEMDDAAVVSAGGSSIAITTDSYVVNPVFFPGGDIGSLSVHGTVNDLAVRGARPLYLTATFILEEGLPLTDLGKIVESVNAACRKAEVRLVAGDTKVVNRGAADRLFITTTGVGILESDPPPGAARVKPGDRVIVSGNLGLHGMAVMCAREGLELETEITSDSAALNGLVSAMLEKSPNISCMRDLTRGGLASAVNEIAVTSRTGIELSEGSIPVHPQVKAACELLGLDPLYVACEGRLIAFVPESSADCLLEAMRSHPLGADACLIGRVADDHKGRVVLKSRVGGRRILDRLSGEQLPRIC